MPSTLKTLGYVAIAEAVSFVCLLIAMVFKYGYDAPRGVTVFGQIHGLLFMAYVFLALIVAQRRRWDIPRTLTVLAAAVVPVAGYIVGHRLLRESDTPA